MKKLSERTAVWLKVTPQTPLLLTGKTAVSNFQQSQSHISGGTLRGAIGSKLLRQSRQAFEALFADEEPYFGNGYYGNGSPIWPFPLTAQSCKRYPGFVDESGEEKHGVIDLLADDFAYDMVSDPMLFADLLPMSRERLQSNIGDWFMIERLDIPKGLNPEKCPDKKAKPGRCAICCKPLAPINGTYFAAIPKPFNSDKVPVARKTQVAINRARAVAQHALLYTQERLDVVDQGAFYAQVSLPADKVAVLAAAIEGTFYIGRGRSKGNGRIVIQIITPPEFPSIAGRLYDLNSRLKGAFQPYAKAQPDKVSAQMPGTFFSLTLRSPAILHHAGRPLRVPTSQMLNLSQATHIHPVRAWARLDNVSGWDSAARLPRRRELAVRAGSVYLFWADETVDPVQLQAELERLELNGIGAARERGFGQLTVCAPFHYADLAGENK